MIVVHAVWSSDRGLCLWGEDSSLPARAPRRPGRPARVPRPRPHPFASSTAALETALEHIGVTLPRSAARDSLTLVLPSWRQGPQASPRLLRAAAEDGAPGRGDHRVDAWDVPVVALGAGAAVLDVALSLPSAPVGGVVVGESLRFGAEATKLALELVARGRLRPALVRRGDAWVARWLAVADDPEDAARVALLRSAAPGAVAAARAAGTADAVVGDMVAAQVDALARELLDDPPAAPVASPVDDRWWNPAVEDQASDRAFRIGQRKNVQVRKLTCVGTLEERIDELIASKRELAESIVGSGEAWLTELDTAQLRKLVALSGDAVAA